MLNNLAALKAKIKIKNPRIRAGIGPKPTISLGKWHYGPSPGPPRAKEKIKNHVKHFQDKIDLPKYSHVVDFLRAIPFPQTLSHLVLPFLACQSTCIICSLLSLSFRFMLPQFLYRRAPGRDPTQRYFFLKTPILGYKLHHPTGRPNK